MVGMNRRRKLLRRHLTRTVDHVVIERGFGLFLKSQCLIIGVSNGDDIEHTGLQYAAMFLPRVLPLRTDVSVVSHNRIARFESQFGVLEINAVGGTYLKRDRECVPSVRSLFGGS